MMGPIPAIAGVRIVSLVLLRDPIERIKSAYLFERAQDADTPGARLAKETDFDGYVRTRLSWPNDRQCRNFQTGRLATMVPGPEPELERARAALERITVVGRVEAFDAAMERLARTLHPAFPGFVPLPVKANTSRPNAIKAHIATQSARLDESNQDDYTILAIATGKAPPITAR